MRFSPLLPAGFVALLLSGFHAQAASLQACGRTMDVPAAYGGRITAICGLHAPEDFDAMPDGKHIIISDMRITPTTPSGLHVLDVATNQLLPLARPRDKGPDWGDPACIDAGEAAPYAPHGINIFTRPDGAVALLVVTHSQGERIEFYQLKQQAHQIVAAYRGCVATDGKGLLNAVAPLPGGGFAASVSFLYADMQKPNGFRTIVSGIDTGYMLTWDPRTGLRRLPNSEAPFNNGVQTSKDGKLIYFAAWSGNMIDVYDRTQGKIVRRIKLDFSPDNLRIGPNHTIVAAGIGNVTACLDNPASCVNKTFVSAWDPATDRVTPLFYAPEGLLRGTTAGLPVGKYLYVTSIFDPLVLKISPAK